jgi:hypothetical protein
MTATMTATKPANERAKRTPVRMNGVDTPTPLATINAVECARRNRQPITETTMNKLVPFVWRMNYRNDAASPEKTLEIAHEKARQYLRRAVAQRIRAEDQP